LVKDNISTKYKLNTTAGSFALLGSVVPRDAGVVTKLRKAGAIILGKATLSEWSHYRSSKAPLGWSARGGQGKVTYYFLITYCEIGLAFQFNYSTLFNLFHSTAYQVM
jgi:amidase